MIDTSMIVRHALAALSVAASFGIAAMAEGEERRSQAQLRAFEATHLCPSTGRVSGPGRKHNPCPGYVIDHIVPLACGGPDRPSNMQWQTIAEGEAKDGWERHPCGRMGP